MEVHHHPDLHHHKKKFSEYFLEFLMIFLAVTMGFIAENIREGISDHKKEKEYIVGVVNDLKQDTANLRIYIHLNQAKIAGMDTLLSLAGKDLSEPANRQLFYYCCRHYMNSVSFFKNTDVTLAQLKSTGSYRLIQKDSAANKIAAYDLSIPRIYEQEQTYDKGLFEAEETLFEIMDMSAYNNPAYFVNGKPTGKELPPIMNDPQKLKVYFNKVFFAKMVILNYSNHFLTGELQKANQLILFLQKAYKIEDN